jgi:hypothetical protein
MIEINHVRPHPIKVGFFILNDIYIKLKIYYEKSYKIN